MNIRDFAQILRLVVAIPVLALFLLAAILASLAKTNTAHNHALLAALTAAVGLIIGLIMRSLLRRVARAYIEASQELEGRAQQTSAAEERYRISLASIADAVILTDPEGRVVSMNPVAEHITDIPFAAARLQPLPAIFHPADEQTRVPLDVDHLPQHTLLERKDGTTLPIETHAAPIRRPNGQHLGTVLVFRDLTPARQALAKTLASEKLAAAGKVAANLAHAIHNPLDAVSNVLHLLAAKPPSEETAELLQMASTEIARATAVSRSLLKLYPKTPDTLDEHWRDSLTQKENFG